MKYWLASALALAGGALAPEAWAQTDGIVTEDGKQIYLPAFFERFAPRTANDMLRNVPGFQVREANQGRRGLGQGGTNVLIDGSRVSGKTTGPIDILNQTPASAVVRIEILDGASLGISGLSGQVANVVLDKTQTTVSWEYNPQFRKGIGSRLTNGSVSVSGRRGKLDYTIGFENDGFRNGAWGDELVTGPGGDLLEYRYETSEPSGENPSLSLTLSHTDDTGREFNANAKGTLFYFDRSNRSKRFPQNGDPASVRLVNNDEEEWNTELGADYAFDAFGGRLKLIGFNYREYSDFGSEVIESSTDDVFLEGDRFDQIIDEGESIARAEQSWTFGEDRTLEFAAEAAFNFNEATAELFVLDAGGGAVEIPLDGANTRIEERRGEASVAYTMPIGKLTLQSSLAVEYSELEQSGDVANKRSFVRPKGFVSASYQLTPRTELRGKVERRVGQLNFFAFASSVNLDNENGQMGNSELVPEQSWLLESAVEHKFADDSQVTLSVDYERYEDVVQQVPIDGGDGPGNVDEASRWSVHLSGTQMLKRVGIDGAQIDYSYGYHASEIEDPFSGELRRLNGESIFHYDVTYRHDIPKTDFAYGVTVNDFKDARQFRRSEITRYDQSAPAVELFVEHKDVFGATAQLYVFNILNFSEDFERVIFDDARPVGNFLLREANELKFNPIVGINLSGSF
jgi:hypothetical protein